jgi:ribosomal protein S18 acetylase RimI-like enzyme
MLDYFTKYWGGWKPEAFRKDFDVKSTKIIFKNNRRVGYYVLKNKEDYFYLENIQISSTLIGKGIGTYLMNVIEKEVSQSSIRTIRLQVFKDNPAQRLYEKFRYKNIQDNGNSVIMEKEL